MNDARLDYENLDVYRAAIEFLHVSVQVTGAMPRGESELRSQLKRAAMSIPLNVAEASGKPTEADRARYYAIARGSAMECGALLEVCTITGYVTSADAERGKRLLVRIVAMLTKMCR